MVILSDLVKICFLNFISFLVLRSIGDESRPIEALLSACALGILHDDIELSELVLNELKQYERDDLWCHHIAFLTSEFYLKKVIVTPPIKYLGIFWWIIDYFRMIRPKDSSIYIHKFITSPINRCYGKCWPIICWTISRELKSIRLLPIEWLKEPLSCSANIQNGI